MRELIITNAQIWAPEKSSARCVLVRNGRIAAVGDTPTVKGMAGPSATHIDAEGAAVLPGFHDAHIHPIMGGLNKLSCDLEDEHSLEGYEKVIREYAEKNNDEWILGGGWFGDVFPGGLPTKNFLDRLVPDRPVALNNHDGHGMWVNSKALEIAGINKHTPEPRVGRIVRDSVGEPTGVLLEMASDLVAQHLPEPDADMTRKSLLTAQKHLLSLGVTAWHDAIIGEYLSLSDSLDTYLEVINDGSLIGRVSGSIWWPPESRIGDLDKVLARVFRARAAGFNIQSIKIMQDGMCENCTAAMLAPYSGLYPETVGASIIPPAELQKIVTALDAEGFSVHFHGVGDRAVRECLDAVEVARTANDSGVRHQIAHLDVVDPTDIPRFAQLNVTANLQPLWARSDQEILQRKLPLLGDRAALHFPFGSLHQSRAHLAIGSDWPVTSPNPLWGLFTACTRTAPSNDPHALNPESRQPMQPVERLDLETALRAYTKGSAEVSGFQDIGCIKEGYLADLVVLSRPLQAAQDLDTAVVSLTVLNGEIVYDREQEAIESTAL